MKVELNIEWLLKKRKIKLRDLERVINISYQQLWNIKQWRTSKIMFKSF